MDPRALLSRQTSTFQSPALRQITLEVLKVNGVNLGQGVCNLPVPPYVAEQADRAIQDGVNRYTNPRGLASLRGALAEKLANANRIDADPDRNILVSSGVTGAFEGVCGILLDPGDEVVVFEPFYPYHVQALRRYQAEIRFVPLEDQTWSVDFDRLRKAVTRKTKFVLLNTPNNPTGKIWSLEELEEVGRILEPTHALLVTDEIYEYMVFDGLKHVSPASIPSLAHRTLTMGGYSKTFSITGWRIGYVVPPLELADAMSAFLDAVYACAPAPLQEAVAAGILHFGPEFYQDLEAKYETKRNAFAQGLRNLGLNPLIPEGAYYLICRLDDDWASRGSAEFCNELIRQTGVGAVPSSDFVRDPARAPWIRFCLANEDDVLEDALHRMERLRL